MGQAKRMEGVWEGRGRIREMEKEGGGEGEQGRAHFLSSPHGFPGNMAHRLLAHKEKVSKMAGKSFVNRFKPA